MVHRCILLEVQADTSSACLSNRFVSSGLPVAPTPDSMTSGLELACTQLVWSTTAVSSALPEKYLVHRPSSQSVSQIRGKEITKAIGSFRSSSGKALLGQSCNMKGFKIKNNKPTKTNNNNHQPAKQTQKSKPQTQQAEGQ